MGKAETIRNRGLPDHEQAICRRFRQIRERAGLSQAKFAKELNLPLGSVSFYEYGKTALSAEIALRTCFFFLVNERWLATGIDPIEPCVDLYRPPILMRLNRGELYSNAYERILSKEIDQLETMSSEKLVMRLLKSDINTEERLTRVFEYVKFLFLIWPHYNASGNDEIKMTDREFLEYFYGAGITAVISLFNKCGLEIPPIIPAMRAAEENSRNRKK